MHVSCPIQPVKTDRDEEADNSEIPGRTVPDNHTSSKLRVRVDQGSVMTDASKQQTADV